ncbi:mitochondrial ribosomal subunit S27-domain-containing protein [Protomyces lactucae-debilis]|uniref:Small ribosomal subunit protein mS33 n=1 Tax=Protomyces lactucae-debilis TaxID=2754530 RepID=A0A1Y2F4T0_PROLT|nr:mitochondrial ribosomal subunit S27-domain-containing protein [Protomyces lactucae-debilis]ORY78677.1 mitochondrial ribosomal subunit S27-domain-containing protein [Protomyces lactucae-debilis]
MAAPIARIQALQKLSCSIFNRVHNPTAQRFGNKILRQRLRGPALLDYYPTENVKLQTIIRAFPELGLVDEAEEIRKADVDARKRRGKGPPPKGQGRRAAKNKKR